MRTVYLGTSAFAAAVLERLAGGPHRPALVITRPDRPRGRGRRVAAPPVAQRARELGLPVAQPEVVNDEATLRLVLDTGAEAACVCAFGAIVREPLLSALPMLNVHPSLLPRWRGAAPIERAIMAGDERTGVSIMRLEAGLDSGPVCLRQPVAIAPDDTYGTVSTRLEAAGGELLERALSEAPAFAEQPEEGVTYAEKITAADRTLDPSRPASELERVVRALHPHVGARLAEPALGVRAARVVAEEVPPGTLSLAGGRLLLGCAEGTLELLVVQPAGGRAMDAAAYVRGRGG